jgi:hypothetical protein
MGLPFQKESMQDLTARFPSALKRIFDVEKMAGAGSDRPGNNRDNVFDFIDNTRMIISLDCYNDYLYLHISASNKDVSSGQELFESIISKIVLLKIGDSSLGALPNNANVNITNTGVVHVLYELGKRKTSL